MDCEGGERLIDKIFSSYVFLSSSILSASSTISLSALSTLHLPPSLSPSALLLSLPVSVFPPSQYGQCGKLQRRKGKIYDLNYLSSFRPSTRRHLSLLSILLLFCAARPDGTNKLSREAKPPEEQTSFLSSARFFASALHPITTYSQVSYGTPNYTLDPTL